MRIPTLGAFILNKSNTFHLRAGPDGNLKAAKDILYLRDIAASGDAPLALAEKDLILMLTGEQQDIASDALERGLYHLINVSGRYFTAASKILAERDGLQFGEAQADIEGHLDDVSDMMARQPQ